MKKLTALLCFVLVLSLCCPVLALGIEVPTLSTSLIRHRVLRTAVTNEYEEYIVIFYTDGAHVVTQFNDEIHFMKSAGYTMDIVRSMDVSTVFTGFQEMDFADSRVEDKGTYCMLLTRFTKLDYLANMALIRKNGIIPDVEYAYDADRLIRLLIENGATELDMLEYAQLGLDFTVE